MRVLRTFVTLCLFGALTAPALAGPPLICRAIPITSAHSLPWSATAGWNGADPSYDVAHLQQDTLTLLTPSTPVDVREETLRRAAIYSVRRAGLGDTLAVALMARVLKAQAAGAPDAAGWFDAGYFAETLRQAAQVYTMLHGSERDAWMVRTDAQAIDGLTWMRVAVRLGGDRNMSAAVATVERAMHWTAATR